MVYAAGLRPAPPHRQRQPRDPPPPPPPHPGRARAGGGLPPVPPMSRQLVAAAADVLQSQCHAPATVKSRSSQLRAFDQFRVEMAIDYEPPTAEDMRNFAAWVMLYRCSREASMRQYLSAVKTHYHQRNMFVPAPSEYGPLGAVVEGSKRMFPGPVRRSLPVTIPILRNLVFSRAPPAATWRQRMSLRVLKDTALVLYFSMLRSSSLFPPWAAAADPDRNMVWSRVVFCEGGAKISVILAKTQQHFRRVHEVVLAERAGSPYCPVAALRRLKAMRGCRVDPGDHVFQLPLGQSAEDGWRILVKSDFHAWFKRRICQMNLREELYMLHGFRHGAVSLAISEEPNLALVKVASDHSSDAIWTYAQVAAARKRSVASVMLDTVHRVGTAPGCQWL